MNDTNPDYVVVGDTRSYSYEKLEQAVTLVRNGAKLIGANPDVTGPTENRNLIKSLSFFNKVGIMCIVPYMKSPFLSPPRTPGHYPTTGGF